MARRIPNWDVALHRWASSIAGQPYVWGRTDCGTLVRDALSVMYGADLLEAFDRYDTLRDARRVHAESGGVEVALRLIEAIDIAPPFAQSGDFSIDDSGPSFPAAAVVVGRSLLWSDAQQGVRLTPKRSRSLRLLLRVPNGR